jgi:hypothetical protein
MTAHHVTHLLFSAALCLSAILGVVGRAQAQGDTKEILDWFNALGFPDLSSAKLVRVATGTAGSSGGRPLEKQFFPAFLLKTHGRSFTVFLLDLRTETFEQSLPGTEELGRVGYEIIDLKAAVEKYLQTRAKPKEGEDSLFVGHEFWGGIDSLVVARACRQQGHGELARALLEESRKDFGRRFGGEEAKSFRQQLIDAVAQALLQRAVFGFADQDISRKDLLARFELIIDHCPESENKGDVRPLNVCCWSLGRHTEPSRYYRDRLRAMVKEDEELSRRPKKAESEMSRRELIADLIQQLRDQRGQQWSWPGRCEIFNPQFPDRTRGVEGMAADRLATIGLEAVPQLIDALDDKRFSRVVESHHDSVYMLRVSDCARLVIERLAGRTFADRSAPEEPDERDRWAVESKKRVVAWWAEFQRKGEKQMLVEATERGDSDSGASGKLLRQRYPEAALDALNKGIAAATDEWVQTFLTRMVGELGSAEALASLRRQLSAAALRRRVAAAKELHKLGYINGVQPMIEEWGRVIVDDRLPHDVEELIDFLALCGQPEALRALGKDLRRRPFDVRLAAVQAVGRLDRENYKVTPEAAAARDEFLIRAFDDAERCWHLSMLCDDKVMHEPRLGDLAAHELAHLWKMPSAFDINAGPSVRQRQKMDLMNIWRTRQWLARLPLPGPKHVERAPESVGRWLQALMNAANAGERREARLAIEELGSCALPAAAELLARTSANHPAHSELGICVSRLACVVRDVKLGKRSAVPDNDLRARIDSLRGKPLDAKALIDLYVAVLNPLPEGVRGIDVIVEREDDLSGISLDLTLVKGPRPTVPKALPWSYEQSISDGTQGIHGVQGGCIYELGVSGAALDEYSRHLQKLFDGPPRTSISARAKIVFSTE